MLEREGDLRTHNSQSMEETDEVDLWMREEKDECELLMREQKDEEMVTEEEEQYVLQPSPSLPNRETPSLSPVQDIECRVWLAPHLDMEFATLDEAWFYWKNYGGSVGFGVRKDFGRKGKDKVYTSYKYVCQSEGQREKDKRDHLTKIPRAETRTDCKVFLQVKLYRDCQKYKVVSFHTDHNHPLQKPEACHLITTQREVSEVARIDIHLAESSGIRPRETHELLSRQAGGVRSIGYTLDDLNNCIRDKKKKAMEYGAAVAITKYFAKRVSENPFFQHFEDITENQEIVNILWIDGKMLADYARFGEVVIFDTTFGTNKEKWALGTFVGFNHFKEIMIFCAALICDSNTTSFEWVFTKFLEAHNGKRPVTMFTDQESAIVSAIKHVMPDTKHALCVWHIQQNCQKRFMYYKKKGIDISGDFSKCMHKYEDEDVFVKAMQVLAGKVEGDEDKKWVKTMFGCKEKWAYCFMKHAYTLGIRSTQASESINSNLKRYLNVKLDVNRFLEQFERVVDGKREKEVKSEFEMRKKIPRVGLHIPILCEAGKIYTPKIFELFQKEYELSGSAYIENIDGNTFFVGMCNINSEECSNKTRQVVWNRGDQSIACCCKKFERMGILCCHALKVLDREDIKIIPPKYILKRWTQDAKDEYIVNREGKVIIEDTMLEVRNRRAQLMRELAPTYDKAAFDEEQTQFLLNVLRSAREQYEDRYGNSSKTANDHGQEISNSQPENSLRLKKKNGDNRSKRKKAWNENLSKRKKGNGRSISNSQPLR
ncbi:hypothetical protein LUZ61_003415 [Rhynchospora tenuis]|uniref:SWIM-type domain-containing protein n=1 Tax=Rhynchospora tenuis TaxID=198213 RepID=A0AAD5ZKR8_9POAL|nr:hypothetical protein LUZ61_003415 [Rhynchospora tenuis]